MSDPDRDPVTQAASGLAWDAVTVSGSRASLWKRGPAAMERLGDEGLDLAGFRDECLRQLRSLLSVDAAFFATVDPVTMLFTSALAEEPLAEVTTLFLDNEFGQTDVNKFARLAASHEAVGSLDLATNGQRSTSPRYREVLAPLGLGDEVRVALVSNGSCWGVLCLHREESSFGFDGDEIALLRAMAPHVAAGLRRTTALFPARPESSAADGPGIVILDTDLSVISINPQAERWLGEIADGDGPNHLDLPMPIVALASSVVGDGWEGERAPTAARLRRREGGWINVQASRLNGIAGPQVAVILDAASTSQVSSLLLAAHGLTPAQSRVAALVLQGRSTRSIVSELHISSNTLQEHLHAVFDKFGVGSRRELVVALSGRPG